MTKSGTASVAALCGVLAFETQSLFFSGQAYFLWWHPILLWLGLISTIALIVAVLRYLFVSVGGYSTRERVMLAIVGLVVFVIILLYDSYHLAANRSGARIALNRLLQRDVPPSSFQGEAAANCWANSSAAPTAPTSIGENPFRNQYYFRLEKGACKYVALVEGRGQEYIVFSFIR